VTRLLVIPAAGRGTRLGWEGPKLLCPVAGRAMIDHLLERYRPLVDRVVLVVAPSAEPLVRRHLAAAAAGVEFAIQETPDGMLPAILRAHPSVETHRPRQVWITWCDQVAISARTVDALAAELDRHPEAALVFPTARQSPPYIHFPRDDQGRIAAVLQRREGDAMPEHGESDAGLFAVTGETFTRRLPEFDRVAAAGAGTRERNFLPFIPWLAARAPVRTFDLADVREAAGVNTRDDLRRLEAYLRDRA
jgi:bifunctional UDP-N-acetylglucosamine pyrophosphorylase/glucosamine-1-phosphate N-acetyltransferase